MEAVEADSLPEAALAAAEAAAGKERPDAALAAGIPECFIRADFL